MDELATVLRAWRDRVTPEQAGLLPGAGRRTPGLRREELAALAGVSVEYLVRLEQGRARHPSSQLLASLARALRLTTAERDHLFRVAGVAVPSGLVPTHLSPGVQRIVDRLGDVPVGVFTAAWDVLSWNRPWALVSGDPTRYVGIEGNVAWRHFVVGQDTVLFDDVHAEEFSDDLVADLREATGRYPGDPHLADVVARLRAASPDFERRWGDAHVARHRSSRKVVQTAVGPIAVDCDVVTTPDGDLRLVVYTVVPGSDDASRLALLDVVGVEPA